MNNKTTFLELSIPLQVGIISAYLFLIGSILQVVGWI